MWFRYRINVLKAFRSGKFGQDSDAAAEFIADEYDKAIRSGGDFIYGVSVLNANKKGMADVLKRAFKKGQRSSGENFNLLKEICPSAFDAYWNGAEMAPFPNPLIKPLGWIMTPPAPGAVMNIGPNPISLAQSAAFNKALVIAAELVLKALEKIEIEDPKCGKIRPFEVATKMSKNKRVPDHLRKTPAVISAKEAISLFKILKSRKPSIGPQFKPSIKIPFPPLPKRKEIIKKLTDKAKEKAKEELKKEFEKQAKEVIINQITTQIVQAKMVNPYNINEAVIKQYVRDIIDGKNPQSPFPIGVEIPKIPTKEELDQKIKEKVPSDSKLDSLAGKKILGKIPDVPYVHFIQPTTRLSTKTNVLIDPFINAAKVHLMSRGGTMMVMAQYPPPAPPAPAMLLWQGYNIRGGPPVPPLLPKFPIPLGNGKFLKPEKGAVTPEQADKELEAKLNPPVQSGNTILAGTGVTVNIPQPGSSTPAQNQTPISVAGGQTITDRNNTKNNLDKNKC